MNGHRHRARHWAWWCMLFYMFGQGIVGVLGAFDPSPGLHSLDLVDLYSVLTLSFAVLGLIGLFINPRVVMWSIYGMAFGAVVHGLSVVFLPGGSLQTGIRLLIAPFMMVPMGHLWWKYHVLDSMLDREA